MSILEGRKRSWPLRVGIVFTILFFSGVFFWIAVSGIGRKTPATPVRSLIPVVEHASSTFLVPRRLDGVLVGADEANLLSFGVMIDNHADARPTAGLAAANLVVEAPVEGGLTRYFAVYDATTTAESIGPVRSARPYFVEIADGLNAVYAHVGGSSDALLKIKSTPGFRDLDEVTHGKYFWRSGKRLPPYQIFTRMDLLRNAALAKAWRVSSTRSWSFKEDAPLESTTTTIRGNVHGPILAYGGVSAVSWTYDRASNMYLRVLARAPHIDADGTRIQAKNVLVLLSDATVVDAEGRLKLRTTGRGRARLFRDGRFVDAAWHRSSGEQFQCDTVDGKRLEFNRGTTWIEILTSSTAFDQTGED